MPIDVFEWVWTEINRRVDELRRLTETHIARSEFANYAGGVDEIAFADLPTAADGATNGNLYWVTNGRKTGEGAAAGTGVLAYYNETTSTWKRVSDDADISI